MRENEGKETKVQKGLKKDEKDEGSQYIFTERLNLCMF
jgi:hypothetical protein